MNLQAILQASWGKPAFAEAPPRLAQDLLLILRSADSEFPNGMPRAKFRMMGLVFVSVISD